MNSEQSTNSFDIKKNFTNLFIGQSFVMNLFIGFWALFLGKINILDICSAESATEAISLALDSVSHRLKAR